MLLQLIMIYMMTTKIQIPIKWKDWYCPRIAKIVQALLKLVISPELCDNYHEFFITFF